MAEYSEIYDFEGQIEGAFQSWLTSRLEGAQVLTSKSGDTIAAPVVTAKLEHEGALTGSETQSFLHNSIQKESLFAGTLTLTLRAVRGSGKQPAMNRLRALVRGQISAMCEDGGINEAATLPYHVVNEILDTGASNSTEEDEEIDQCDLSLALKYSIRTTVWP